jgi:hypothetical protein
VHNIYFRDFSNDLLKDHTQVKPKYLENVKIDAPSSSLSGTVGVLHRKHRSYDVWSVGNNEGQPVGGEEVRGFTCLLPRKKKNGKLYKGTLHLGPSVAFLIFATIFLRIAPKPIARHLVLSAQDVIPTPDPSVPVAADSARTHQNPPRQSYPEEALKYRFMPYGSLVANDDATSAHEMDIDMEVDGEKGIERGDETPGKKLKDSKGKKRKVEGDTPKKSKKAKTIV